MHRKFVYTCSDMTWYAVRIRAQKCLYGYLDRYVDSGPYIPIECSSLRSTVTEIESLMIGVMCWFSLTPIKGCMSFYIMSYQCMRWRNFYIDCQISSVLTQDHQRFDFCNCWRCHPYSLLLEGLARRCSKQRCWVWWYNSTVQLDVMF